MKITVIAACTDTDNGTELFVSLDEEATTRWIIDQFIEQDGWGKFQRFLADGGADLYDFLEPQLGLDSWSRESFELEIPAQLPFPQTGYDQVKEAIECLQRARDLLKASGNLRTLLRVRSAISSARGALRIQDCRDARTQHVIDCGEKLVVQKENQ